MTCEYKATTTYSDEIEISVTIEKYSGVRLSLAYVMKNVATGRIVAEAHSSHCFIDKDGQPIIIRKHAPQFDAVLRELTVR